MEVKIQRAFALGEGRPGFRRSSVGWTASRVDDGSWCGADVCRYELCEEGLSWECTGGPQLAIACAQKDVIIVVVGRLPVPR